MDEESFVASLKLLGFRGPYVVTSLTSGADFDRYTLKVLDYICVVYIRMDNEFGRGKAYLNWLPPACMAYEDERVYADTRHPPILTFVECLRVITNYLQKKL